MILLAFVAQLAVADSIYATPALRELVARAVRSNRAVPAELRSYGARLESEIAIVARSPEATETVFSVEQVESDVRWQRTGDYEQRVTGYRSQYFGFSFSTLGFIRQSWTVPVLYGNRLSLFFGRDTTRGRGVGRVARRGMAPVLAIHPFADDRERIYRYRGGDTVQILRTGGRVIPVVRVLVEPRTSSVRTPIVAFRGEVEVDVGRDQIVRMRGYFVNLGRRRDRPLVARVLPIEAVAYVELENAEIDGRFWLPSYQRFEAQAAFPGLSDSRSILRIATRFRDHRINDPSIPERLVAGDSLRPAPHTLRYAARDSLARFDDWAADLGEQTGGMKAEDFDDIAPNAWRQTGPPQLRFGAQRFGDIVHYTRIEGLYTGGGVIWKLRDTAPGLDVRAAGGWAWTERVARGRLTARWDRGRWIPQLRVSRSLDLTNDFRNPLDSGATMGPLIWSVDDNDYVDRRQASLGIARLIGARRQMRVRMESGVASDRYARTRLVEGLLFTNDSTFRINRGIAPGRYVRTYASFELNPGSSAEFMRPGFGAQLQYERGDGEIDYQRAELRITARRNWGPVSWASRLDAGALLGPGRPPQQLFEIGEAQNLPGYDYKEFAGDRAVVARARMMYRLPIAQAPIPLWKRYMLPGPGPALAFGVQSGWTDASSDAASRSIAQLGYTTDPPRGLPGSDSTGRPLSRPTGHPRTTIDAGLRLFGGAIGLGVARAVDHRASWRFVLSLVQDL